MYITKVKLKNVRCFKHVEFDLSSGNDVHKWGVILGDNGFGKTTILRSIAMGLCDKTGASSLLQDTYGDWVRWGEKEATIKLDLLEDGQKYSIETIIHHEPGSRLEIIHQVTESKKDFPWGKIFVCGYGANRSIQGDTSYEAYSLADALYSLFNYKGSLQNPELMLWRHTHTKKKNEICGWLDEILMLENGSTKLDEGGIKIKGKWGRDVYLGSLPDGYVATVTFVLDMIGWGTLKNLNKQKNNLSGIILIDELEQHLHPSWQKYFIKLLHEVFPNNQFIATTHSPLCAVGTANLSNADEVCSLLALHQDGDHVVGQDKIRPPRGKRADQILTSTLFGLDTSRSDDIQQQIEKYSQLLAKASRTKDEEEKLTVLQDNLNKELGSAETELQQLVEKAVHKALDSLVSEISNENKPPQEAADFEIKRQLKELFG